jgi:UDP-N-acetyl-D-galactosamine dehydrogenase
VDIIRELQDFGVNVLVTDPLADPNEAVKYYGVDLQPLNQIKDLDAVILAVMHRVYREEGLEGIAGRCADSNALVIDVKGCFSPDEAQKLGVTYWRL